MPLIWRSLFLTLLLLHSLEGTSNPPTWQSNSLIKAGVKTIVSGGSYQQGNKYGPYVVTYSSAFSNSVNSGVGVLSIDIDPAPAYIEYKVNLNDPNNPTQLQINMGYVSINWLNFKVTYIAIDTTITYLKVSYLNPSYTTQPVTAGTGLRTYQTQYNTNINFDSSHQLSIIPYMTGVKASASLEYAYGLTFSKLNNTHITYTLTADGDTTITQITSYILVYDSTDGQGSQEIFLDSFQVFGTNNVLDPITVEYYAAQNLIIGVSSIYYTAGLSFDFDTTTLTLSRPTSSASFSSIAFSFWSFRKRSCSPLTPYYQKTANLCYDVCQDTHLQVDPQKYCQSCSVYMSNCLNCTSQTVCTLCADPFEISAGGDACECPTKTYLDGVTCPACHLNCATCNGPYEDSCLTCDQVQTTFNSATDKCDCIYGQYSTGGCKSACTNGDCIQCPDDPDVCTKCKNTFLLGGGRCRCPQSYYYDLTTRYCYECHQKCYICTGNTDTDCVGCYSQQMRQLNTDTYTCDCKDTYYDPSGETICIKEPSTDCPTGFEYNAATTFCDDICGDGLVFDLECDDGNTQSLDGCSKDCLEEEHFSCLYGDQTSPSICSYDGNLIFRISDAQKDLYGSKVIIWYDLEPKLSVYEKFPNFKEFIAYTNANVEVQSAIYDSKTQFLKVVLKFKESLVGKTLTLSYTPPSSPYAHAIVSSSQSWRPKVSNGMSLSYQNDSVYEDVSLFYYLTLAIVIMSQLLFCLALFFRKMIGVQQMCLLQLSFLSFVILKQAHPYAGVITTWKFIFGYNEWEGLPGGDDTDRVSSMYWALGYKEIYGMNVNFMLIAILCLYFLSASLFLIGRFVAKSSERKFREASLIFAREIAFGAMLLSLANFMTSYAVEFQTGRIWSWMPQYSGAFKIISLLVVAANYIVYALYYKESIESYVFYNKRLRMGQVQPIFIATKQIILSIGIYLVIYMGQIVLYCLMGIQFAYFFYLIYLRPFKRPIDFVRSLMIEGTMALILTSRFLEYSFVSMDQPGGWGAFVSLAMPLEYSLIGACMIISWASLGIHLFKTSKRETQINPDQLYSEVDLNEQKEKQQFPIQKKIERQNLHRQVENKMRQQKEKQKQPEKEKEEPSKQQQGNDNIQRLKQKLLFTNQELNNGDSISNLLNGGIQSSEPSKRKLFTKKQEDDEIQVIAMDQA